MKENMIKTQKQIFMTQNKQIMSMLKHKTIILRILLMKTVQL